MQLKVRIEPNVNGIEVYNIRDDETETIAIHQDSYSSDNNHRNDGQFVLTPVSWRVISKQAFDVAINKEDVRNIFLWESKVLDRAFKPRMQYIDSLSRSNFNNSLNCFIELVRDLYNHNRSKIGSSKEMFEYMLPWITNIAIILAVLEQTCNLSSIYDINRKKFEEDRLKIDLELREIIKAQRNT